MQSEPLALGHTERKDAELGRRLISRRDMLAGALAAMITTHGFAMSHSTDSFETRLAEIESKSGGRLGCAVLNTSTGSLASHRGAERFPMCSTFKMSAVALVLSRVDHGQEQLERRIVFSEKDILAYAPVTRLHVGGDGMSIKELCEAAMTVSDNTAANLLIASFGGPAALTKFWRSVGDHVSRLDRIEPDMSESKPGDSRDTTSPVAMLEDMRKFVLGDVLKPASRELLKNWLVGNTTGDARLRAGLPHDWVIGDKTGSGDHATSNDIAVIWPPNRKPFLVTAYLTDAAKSNDARNAVLVELGRVVAEMVTQSH